MQGHHGAAEPDICSAPVPVLDIPWTSVMAEGNEEPPSAGPKSREDGEHVALVCPQASRAGKDVLDPLFRE